MLEVQAAPAQPGAAEPKAKPSRMAQRPVSTGCFSCENLREMYGRDRAPGAQGPAPVESRRSAVALGGAAPRGLAGPSAHGQRGARHGPERVAQGQWRGRAGGEPCRAGSGQARAARAPGAPGGQEGLARRWESLGAHEGAAWRQHLHSPGKSRLSRAACSMPPETAERTGAAGTRLAVARGKETKEKPCVEILLKRRREHRQLCGDALQLGCSVSWGCVLPRLQ